MKIRSLNHLTIYGHLLASYNFPKTCNVGLLQWFSVTLPFTFTLYFTLTSINTSKFRLKMTCKNYFSLYILCCFFKKCLSISIKKRNENISYLYKKNPYLYEHYLNKTCHMLYLTDGPLYRIM